MSAPVRSASCRTAPVMSTLVRSAPDRLAADRLAFIMTAPVRSQPDQLTPGASGPVQLVAGVGVAGVGVGASDGDAVGGAVPVGVTTGLGVAAGPLLHAARNQQHRQVRRAHVTPP